MNSRDIEMIDRAAGLLRAALDDAAWRPETQQWLDDYYAQYAKVRAASEQFAKTGEAQSGPIGTRWRPIDQSGVAAQTAAPEPPDEPDEGETGPDQVNA